MRASGQGIGLTLGIVAAQIAGCSGQSDGPSSSDTPGIGADTDDSDQARADTDARDTDAGDTDTSPFVDTGPPPDPALPTPPAWGPGFVMVGGDMETRFPPVFVGDRAQQITPELTSIAVGDIDEDGALDVIVTSRPANTRASAIDRRYALDAGSGLLVERTALDAGQPFHTGMDVVLGLLDLDGDGHLDAVRGNFDDMVQWGRGDGTLERGTGAVTGVTTCGVVNSATLWDVDGDGWSDWVVGPDLCRGRLHVLRRVGPRRWEDQPDWVVGAQDGVETSAVLVLPTPTEQLFLEVGDRDLTVDEPGWCVAPRDWSPGAALTRTSRTPSPLYWTNMPRFASAGVLDVAAMGAATEDLDSDGWLDVLLTIGEGPVAAWAGSAGGLVDRTVDAGLTISVDRGVDISLPWSLIAVDLDQDGRLDVFSTIGDDSSSFVLQDGQANRNRLWWSRGAWDYVDVTVDAGLTQRGGWLAAAAVDLDQDGDADLALGGNGQGPTLLRNDVETGHHGVSLKLIGTTSTREALGATIEVEASGLPTLRRTVTMPANFGVITPPVQFVGVGQATKLDVVRIHWPSGWTQVLRELPVDTLHTVVEPEVIRVEDPDRSAPADGASRVGITVQPRLTNGQVNAHATVQVQIEGTGSVSLPRPSFVDGAYRTELVAPASPGEARLTVLVDGVPYTVHPTVWWR